MRHQAIREHAVYLLQGGGAHLNFDAAVADLPPTFRGAKVDGVSHTAWRLVEHMRICLWDILEFSRNPDHVSPPWPEGYWPPEDAPPTVTAWDESVAAYRADLQALIDLVSDPKIDPLAPLPHGDGQTILREALLAADHAAYHLGQLVLLRRALGVWED